MRSSFKRRVTCGFMTVCVWLAIMSPAAFANRWGRQYVPNLPVVTQHGEILNFYDDVVKGRRLVISFIFTSCREMCPLITARLTQVYEGLGEAAGRDVRFVSISVDPLNDTPARLKEHADAFRVGSGWLFLTGTPETIKAIRNKLGDRNENILDHRQDIWLVNDSTGDWQRDSAFSDIGQLVHNIRAQVPGEATRHLAAPKRATGASPVQPGQVLFAKACAACHSIGQGDKVGPDLVDVSRRHERAWLTGFIRDPQRYRVAKDPVTLTLMERFKGVRMPTLGLKTSDVEDLIAYIDAKSFAFTSPVPDGHAHHAHAAGHAPAKPVAKAAPAATRRHHH